MPKLAYFLLLGLGTAGCGQYQTPPPSTKPQTTVSWNTATDNVKTFELYKNDQPMFPAPVEINSFIDKDIQSGQKYCYYVVPIFNNIQGEPSNTACVIP